MCSALPGAVRPSPCLGPRHDLGSTEGWAGCFAWADEVYLYRATVTGANIRTPRDAMLFARAVGVHNRWLMSVRAVLVNPLGSGKVGLEVVMGVLTATPEFCTPMDFVMGRPTPQELAHAIVTDSEIQASFPKIELSGYQMVELTGPAGAVDFWRAHHLIWDRSQGDGIPTQKYGLTDGVYFGQAEDAPNVKKWLATDPPLDVGDRPAGKGAMTSSDVLWIGGAVAAVWLGSRFLDKRQGRRAA